MFLQDGVLHGGGRSIETTVYAVTEGDEPVFFTNFFNNWDNSKQSSVSLEHTNGNGG
jgi:advillin